MTIPKLVDHEQSLTERIYHRLRREIITGRIPSRTRLVESTLAEEMQVSRTPVREALQKLTLEGLLLAMPRAGYMVAELSDEDIQDLFETRMDIEKIAGRRALEHIGESELDALSANLERMDRMLQSGMLQNLAEIDQEFHDIIYRASRSKTLYRICLNLSDHTLKFRIALSMPPGLARKTRDHHRNIYQALRQKDAHQLEKAIHNHLAEASDQIIILLKELRIEYPQPKE